MEALSSIGELNYWFVKGILDMPYLRRAKDGHYYTTAWVYAAGGIATYQISPEALESLKGLKIAENQEIPRRVFDALRERRLIRTGGGGTGGSSRPEPPDRDLKALIVWGEEGDIAGLETAIQAVSTSIPALFTPGFINWLCAVEQDMDLTGLMTITESDFDRYAHESNRHSADLDVLHRALLEKDGGCRVLWHFARITAFVVSHPGFPDQLPKNWERTVYETVAKLVEEALKQDSGPKPPISKLNKILLPAIYWQVDDQQVVGIFSTQSLPPEATLEWHISPGKAPQVAIRQHENRTVVAETITEPLDPASWRIEVNYSDKDGNLDYKIHTHIPSPDGPCVLFETDGKAISWEEGLTLPLGEYLVLIALDVDGEEVFLKSGISILEEIDFEPIGWDDWRGYRVCVESGTSIGKYCFGNVGGRIAWQIDKTSGFPVKISESVPTRIGIWPQIHVKMMDRGEFEDVSLVIERSEDGRTWTLPWDDISEISEAEIEGGQFILHLSQCQDVRTHSGTFKVRLRFADLRYICPAPLSFRVLMGVDMVYKEDPARPGMAKALAFKGADDITPYAGCILLPSEQSKGWRLTSENPVEEPLIHFGIRLSGLNEEMPLAVHLPVSRVVLQTRKTPIGDWMPLPIELRLGEIRDFNARLKLLSRAVSFWTKTAV